MFFPLKDKAVLYAFLFTASNTIDTGLYGQNGDVYIFYFTPILLPNPFNNPVKLRITVSILQIRKLRLRDMK